MQAVDTQEAALPLIKGRFWGVVLAGNRLSLLTANVPLHEC